MKTADFLKTELEQLGFIELRQDVTTGVTHLPKGMELPLLTSTLRRTIQTGEGSFKTEDVIVGILMLYGLDESFPGKDNYRFILQAIERSTGSLVPFLAELSRSNPKQALICALGYRELELTDDRALLLAIEAANLAHRETQDKRYEELAFALLQQAAEESDDWQVAYHLGYLYYNRDQFTEAIIQFRAALAQDMPEEFVEELSGMVELSERKSDFTRGQSLLFAGRAQEALEIFESLRPDFSEWYSLLFYTGLAYRMEQMYAKALTLFYEALSIKQDDPNLYNELSICHMMNEEPDQAMKHLELALELDPDNPELLTNYGIVLYQLGDTEKAIVQLKHSLQIAPEDELTQQWFDIVQSANIP